MKQLLAKTLCVAGLLTAVTAANAATYDLNALYTFGAGGAAGQGWNVKLTTFDNVNWHAVITSLGAGHDPHTDASTILFGFQDSLGGDLYLASGTAGTNVDPGPPAFGGSWGLTTIQDGFTANQPGSVLRPAAAPGAGSKTFTADFVLDDPLSDVKSFSVVMSKGTSSWGTLQTALTPEMPAGVLLLAALVPVGLIVRKRSGMKASV